MPLYREIFDPIELRYRAKDIRFSFEKFRIFGIKKNICREKEGIENRIGRDLS